MIDNQPLFSVLIANYNNGNYLQECLNSVFQQTYKNWEIIIVDDKSTDGISNILYKKYKDEPKINIYCNDKNLGCGFSKRRCAELASGQIMAYIDPDDTITPNALQLSVEAHLEHKKASLIYSNLAVCDEHLHFKYVKKPPKKEEVSSVIFGSYVQAVNHLASFKSDSYKRTQGISKDLLRAVDKDLYYKLEEVGSIEYIDQCLYNYRIHAGGISTQSNRLKAEYWSWVVLVRMAERRGLNLEQYYESEILRKFEIKETQFKRLRDYKVGHSILKPLRKIYKLIK